MPVVSGERRIVDGVGTRRDECTAAALDVSGWLFGCCVFVRDAALLLGWLRGLGSLDCVGAGGTSSCGAGLSRFLAAHDVATVEVLRPARRARRADKNDPADAQAAARAVLSGEATAHPVSGDGPVEAIRVLRVTRRSAVKAHTVAADQLKGLLVTAPELVAAPLRGLRTAALIAACARLRPDRCRSEAAGASRRSLRVLAKRHQALSVEISEPGEEITRLCAAASPALIASPGVGAQVAAALLVTVGDNPERCRSEAPFAALCGASPIEASSGQTVRRWLDRGGDR